MSGGASSEPGARRPTLMAVDGDGLVHRAFHGGGGTAHSDGAYGPPSHHEGQPVRALRGMVRLLARAAAELRPDALVIGFDCRERSSRAADYGGYKAHRPLRPFELEQQLAVAPALVEAAGLRAVVPRGDEADDVLASSAALAAASGWRCVAVTNDRDAYALLDESTSVLQSGGGEGERFTLLTAEMLPARCGVPPSAYRDLAALRGDPSDNLPGVPGMGAKTAVRLLDAFGSLDAVHAALDGGRYDEVAAVTGRRLAAALASPEARAVVARNRRVMAMRTDLPLPELSALRLPVRLDRMQGALSRRGINFGPVLWALTGGEPPEPAGPPRAPVLLGPTRRRPALSRAPGPGQLAIF